MILAVSPKIDNILVSQLVYDEIYSKFQDCSQVIQPTLFHICVQTLIYFKAVRLNSGENM